MQGVDTNILVRAYLEDDPIQAQKSQQFLKKATEDNSLFISSYALLEFVWVLKVKKRTRAQIYQALISLVDASGVIIADRYIVLAAAEKYIKGQADFGDYMIMAEGEHHGVHHLKTFDQVLLQENKTTSLP